MSVRQGKPIGIVPLPLGLLLLVRVPYRVITSHPMIDGIRVILAKRFNVVPCRSSPFWLQGSISGINIRVLISLSVLTKRNSASMQVVSLDQVRVGKELE